MSGLRVMSVPDMERIGVQFPKHLSEAVLLMSDAEAKELVRAIEMARMYLSAGEPCTVDVVSNWQAQPPDADVRAD